MADDPYKTLGVARDATEAQVRKAYLKLAKTTHPDLNPGDAKAEERDLGVNGYCVCWSADGKRIVVVDVDEENAPGPTTLSM